MWVQVGPWGARFGKIHSMPDCDQSFWNQLRHDGQKWFYVLWHQFSLSPFSLGTIFGFVLNTSIILIPVGIAYWNGKHYAAPTLVVYLVAVLLKRKGDFSPENLQLRVEGSAERKAHMAAAIMLLDTRLKEGRPLTVADKDQIRGYALDAIVSFVRSHRSDIDQVKIFANLLVEDGENLVILRRDSNCKRALVSYPKDSLLAGRAIELGTIVGSGSIRHEYPATPGNKPYQSVLIIPILPLGRSKSPLGAVSIDSSEPFHFNTHENNLETALMPYTRLLAATL